MPTTSSKKPVAAAASLSEARPKRVLIEDWLPAAAIGVECMRERGSASALAPHTYLHVWWARRPLTAARAAVLGSVVPADFPRDLFERLIGFGRPSRELVEVRKLMDTGFRVDGGFRCDRAFKATLAKKDLDLLNAATERLWGGEVVTIDPMSGGGSIPLESARLGFKSLANEYNPVACSVLEATVDYPFRFGPELAPKARKWGRIWLERITKRLAQFYPVRTHGFVHAYVFARSIPCPDTQHYTPLVPDWHLLKPKGGTPLVAVPKPNKAAGTWHCEMRTVGGGAGQVKEPPQPTYAGGAGVSLFSGRPIPAEYIKAMAQQGKMKGELYAVAVKTPQGLKFFPPDNDDLKALAAAETSMKAARVAWEKAGVIPTERIPDGDKTGESWDKDSKGNDKPIKRGQLLWADMYSPRQLLCFGTLVEELKLLRAEITAAEGVDTGEAVVHLLAFVLDKFANYNSSSSFWHAIRGGIANTFDRHDFSFKLTHAELAPCGAGAGFAWAIDNVTEAYEKIAELPSSPTANPAEITLGSATSLPQIPAGSITAVIVDPPYADNVQYSELADFFYVWLKRTQGHRHPDWFASYLCDHSQEAVVNASRFRQSGEVPTKAAKVEANKFYQQLMAESFRECDLPWEF